MTTSNELHNEPLWIAIERKILEMGPQGFSGPEFEGAIQRLAGSLDAAGFNVSKNAGNMLALRGAVAARVKVGRPLLEDLETALGNLTLAVLANPVTTTVELIDSVGSGWPALKGSQRRAHLLQMVEKAKLDLLVDEAKASGGDAGVRLLIGEKVAPHVIVDRLEITHSDYGRVMAEVEAERAERARVAGLIQEAKGKSDADKIRYLIGQGVADGLIVEMAKVEHKAIDDVRKAMEEEIAEKKRLAEEAAAKKAAEVAGPAVEDIPADEMLEHIEAIREILEFSTVEAEIRVMCEQSSVPKALVDLAVSDPARLDELEAAAGG